METIRRRPSLFVRLALAGFVLLWLFGPYGLRSAVPLWLPFLVALGLEVHFFLGAWRAQPAAPARRGRGPQEADLERFGYDAPELLLVRDRGGDLWVPYSGESGEALDELIEAERERAASTQYLAEPRRSLRPLAVAVAFVAALAAGAWYVDSRSGWNGLSPDERAEAEALYSAEAGRIAGHEVTVGCDTSGEHVGAVQHADGVAIVGGTTAYLTPERCYELYRVAFEGEHDFAQAGRAIAVLAHEAQHLRGVRDEGTTHCFALQSGVELAQRLGVPETTARRLMRQQLAENAVRGRTRPEYLVPEACRDGGRLDLDPGDSEFP